MYFWLRLIIAEWGLGKREAKSFVLKLIEVKIRAFPVSK